MQENTLNPEMASLIASVDAHTKKLNKEQTGWWACPDWCTAHTEMLAWPEWLGDSEATITHSQELLHRAVKIVRFQDVLRTDGVTTHSEMFSVEVNEKTFFDMSREQFHNLQAALNETVVPHA